MISAFVITYNRPEVLRACLKRVSWVDELILVDKDPEEKNRPIAQEFGAHYHTAPWSPVSEDTRAYAESLCHGDWLLRIDDDEILSKECEVLLPALLENHPAVDIFKIPIHHYILGRYHRSEYHETFYRKGTIKYTNTVHAGVFAQGRSHILPQKGLAFITHLSCSDLAHWFEKTNRYTSVKDRFRSTTYDGVKLDFDKVVDYLDRIYALTDALKQWEETQPDGNVIFSKFIKDITDA